MAKRNWVVPSLTLALGAILTLGFQNCANPPGVVATKSNASTLATITPPTSAGAIEFPEFDKNYYEQKYPEIKLAVAQGLFASSVEHFAKTGCAEGRNPNEKFSEKLYRRSETDVAKSLNRGDFEGCAYRHFVKYGRQEGRLSTFTPGTCPLMTFTKVVPWNAKVVFRSMYIGDSTDVTVFWRGTNQTVGTGNQVVEVPATEIGVDHTPGSVALDDSYTNNAPAYVGTYTRYLEYRRSGQVICRSNTLDLQYVGQ